MMMMMMIMMMMMMMRRRRLHHLVPSHQVTPSPTTLSAPLPCTCLGVAMMTVSVARRPSDNGIPCRPRHMRYWWEEGGFKWAFQGVSQIMDSRWVVGGVGGRKGEEGGGITANQPPARVWWCQYYSLYYGQDPNQPCDLQG